MHSARKSGQDKGQQGRADGGEHDEAVKQFTIYGIPRRGAGYLRPMGKKGDVMRKLGGLDALAGLHQAMGGERAELPAEHPAEQAADVPGTLYVSRDKKARKGKEVTLVEGFDPNIHDSLGADVARQLKSHCGVGGGWKEGAVLLQGDHRNRVADWLIGQGYTVKHKGG